MPNSSAIVDWKNKVISEILQDDELMSCFEKSDDELEEIVYNNIFPFNYIPKTQEETEVYLTIQVVIPKIGMYGQIWVNPRLIINIICHQDLMRMRKTGVSADRIDYMSVLLDKMFNGRTDFGAGKLELATNIEDNLTPIYKYRQLVFVGKDLSDNLCGE